MLKSASGPRESLLNSWVCFHSVWFGRGLDAAQPFPPFPLSTLNVYAVDSMHRAG